MNRVIRWIVVCGLMQLIGCTPRHSQSEIEPVKPVNAASPAEALASAPPPAAKPTEPAILPLDVLKVSIHGLQDGALTVRVGRNGTILLPLVEPVSVSGKTLSQAETALNAAYSPRFIQYPSANVSIDKYASFWVAVAGQVARPGLYELDRRGSSLLHAIAQAGGLSPRASLTARVRRGDRSIYMALFDSNRRGESASSAGRFFLADGDVVEVLRRDHYRVFVQGLVFAPGAFELEPGEEVTLLQALGLAGGIDPDFTPSTVTLARTVAGATQTTRYDLSDLQAGQHKDVRVGTGDVVAVEHNGWTRFQAFGRQFFRLSAGVMYSGR